MQDMCCKQTMIPVKKRIVRNLPSSSRKKLKKMRTRMNHYSPSTSRITVSNRQKSVRHVSNMIMSLGGNLWGAKKRRAFVSNREAKDYNEDSNSRDRLTRGDSNTDGGKVDDQCLKGNSLDSNAVSKDCILPSEDANVRAEYTSTTHDETSGILEKVREEKSQKCVENDKGENYTPKRKSIVMDKCSDITATLVDDDDDCILIERPHCNVVETSMPSKRIRRRTGNVDQPTSKSTDEKSCARNMEDSGIPQQKSLHLSLKPEARQKFRESWTLDEVLEASCECTTSSELPNTVKSTDYLQENATTLNSSSTDQKSNAGFDKVVSSRPCISSSDEEAECQIIDKAKVNESTTSDHEEVVRKTTTENTSSPVNLIEPQEKVHLKPLSSVESPPSPVINLPSNQSNHVSTVMEPIEKMQQLPSSAMFLSSNLDFSSQDALSSKICVASTGFQNQASEKPASNLEVGSRTHQLVPPISNIFIDSHVSSVVRAQSSNTRNLSTQRLINNHLIQTVAVQSASMNVPPLCNDPFRNQLERTIRTHDEQNAKTREQMVLQLKSNYEKEMKMIDAKFQEERQKTAYLKMMLAGAKSNPEFPGASRMLHLQDAGFNPMLHQLPIQQNATCPSLDTSSSSRGRAAATLQNSYASAASHTMVLSPDLHASYNTSEIFRDFSARLPISSASRNLNTGGEASHLPVYGPSTFLPASHVSGIPQGMPSHPATPSRINSVSSASRNPQAGVEIHTPAPHLYVSSTFIPSWVSGVPHGMPSHPATPSRNNSNSLPSGILQAGGEICTPAHIGRVPYCLPSSPAAPGNPPASSFSASFSEWLAKPMPRPMAISKVGTRKGHGKENIGSSSHTHTLPFKDMHKNPNRK